MKIVRFSIVLMVLMSLMIGCTQQRATSDVLYQASTFNGLMEGVYDGPTTIGELRQHGDFGIGTFNSLNGEMVGFDGRFYQVRSDGKAYPVSDDVKTPFASVKFFQPDRSAVISKDMDFEQLQKFLNALVPTENIFYAIRIDGTFSYVRTRSVPMQKRPYPRLVEVVKTQPTFEFHNVKGTIVGYRLPPYVNGLNIAGYHLHFLTENADAGGHLLECRIEKASVKMDDCTQFFLNLPQQEDFSKVNLTTQKHEEINKIEH